MKKALSILTAGCLAVSLAACGSTAASSAASAADSTASSAAESTAASDTAAADGQTYKVGICQLVQHVALDAATQGFKDALTEQLGDAVTFEEKNAQGDSNTCSTIINGFVSDNVDLILANATPALQAAQAGTNTIPVLGTSVTEYGVALGIDDFVSAPIFPAPATWLLWMSRQESSRNCSPMQRPLVCCIAALKQTASIRLIP